MPIVDKILVIEDDPTLCETLQFNLELEGYEAHVAYSAEEALKLPLHTYSLILLDVMMGQMSGFALARRLKQDPATANIPIIFCTARDNEDDMVRGLNIGADDYIYKPYTLRNVLTRVKAVLRRTSDQKALVQPKEIEAPKAEEKPSSKDVLKAYGVEIDTRMKRCLVDGREVKLVKKEFEILALLMSHPGIVFTREDILNRVWPEQVVVLETTVNVNITRLRQKLAPYGQHIITRQGYGYGWN